MIAELVFGLLGIAAFFGFLYFMAGWMIMPVPPEEA